MEVVKRVGRAGLLGAGPSSLCGQGADGQRDARGVGGEVVCPGPPQEILGGGRGGVALAPGPQQLTTGVLDLTEPHELLGAVLLDLQFCG